MRRISACRSSSRRKVSIGKFQACSYRRKLNAGKRTGTIGVEQQRSGRRVIDNPRQRAG